MTLIDLSHTISDGMVTFPGLPGPTITDHISREESAAHYADGTTFQIGRIDMVANTGTYLDVPSHRHADMADLAEVPLDQLANLDGVMVDATDWGAEIPASVFDDAAGATDGALLIRTDWSRHWGTDAYLSGHPFIGPDALAAILQIGPRLVGIDSLNIDDMRAGDRAAHSDLLGAGILIVEHLTNLELLPQAGFTFSATPPKITGMGTFPVRAYAVV